MINTTTSAKPFKCDACGHVGEAVYYEVVDAVQDPVAKEKVLSGEAFTYACPECGTVYALDYPMLYNDDDRRCMVYCANGCVVGEEADPVFERFADLEDDEVQTPAVRLNPALACKRRIVATPEDLMEKLDIFYAGLDDRMVELLKVLSSIAIAEDDGVEVEWMVFDRVDPDTGELVFVARSDAYEEGMSDIDVDRADYDVMANDRELIADFATIPYDFYIDRAWALDRLDEAYVLMDEEDPEAAETPAE